MLESSIAGQQCSEVRCGKAQHAQQSVIVSQSRLPYSRDLHSQAGLYLNRPRNAFEYRLSRFHWYTRCIVTIAMRRFRSPTDTGAPFQSSADGRYLLRACTRASHSWSNLFRQPIDKARTNDRLCFLSFSPLHSCDPRTI